MKSKLFVIPLLSFTFLMSACGSDNQSKTNLVEQTTINDTTIESTVAPTSTAKEEPTSTAKEEPTAAPVPIPELTKYKAGQYKVGKDIPAGEYVLFADDFLGGYVERSKDSSGNFESIIFNDNFYTNIIVTVQDSEYLNIKGGYAIPISEVPTLDTSKQGMFKVGTHLQPGEYKIQVDDDNAFGGYVEVSSDSLGELESIRTNDNVETSTYITVNDGEYLQLVHCHIVN